jgi:hypothetical protein
MGIPLDEMMVWDPTSNSAADAGQIHKAKLLLWKGHCSVHQMFQPAHIQKFRAQHPEGLVIAHPECSYEVCRQSDYVGSTEHIVRTIKEGAPNTHWLVGTELNLVNRLAEEVKHEGDVQFMAPTAACTDGAHRSAAPGVDAENIRTPDSGARAEAVLRKLAPKGCSLYPERHEHQRCTSPTLHPQGLSTAAWWARSARAAAR